MKPLRFFYRPGCHLCEDMLAQLDDLKSLQPFDLERVDIDRDSRLEQEYGQRVPVLEDRDGGTLSEVYLDPQAVIRYLQGV